MSEATPARRRGRPSCKVPRVRKTVRIPMPAYKVLTSEAEAAKVKPARLIQDILRTARPDLPWD